MASNTLRPSLVTTNDSTSRAVRRTPSGAANRTTLARALLFACGWICFSVGAIGVVLPGIPTTGPMILALACFAHCSPKFHQWLLTHRIFGPSLQRWEQNHAIPLRAKGFALASMTASFSYIAFLSPLPPWAVAGTFVLMFVGAVFILRCPHEVDPRPRQPRT